MLVTNFRMAARLVCGSQGCPGLLGACPSNCGARVGSGVCLLENIPGACLRKGEVVHVE
jgi:hypothetical protein